MSVATATAIGLGVTAATAVGQVAAAKMGSSASRDAAKMQSAAADQALEVQRTQYQQARQDFDPYRQQGVNAVNQMGQMAGRQPINFDPRQSMGIPGVPQGQQGWPQYPPPQQQMPPQMPQGMPPQGFQQMQRPPMGPQMGQLGMPPQGPPQGQQGPPQQQGPPPQTMQQAGQQEQTVMLRAPNGQTQAVPAYLAPQLIARGAVRVG